MWRDLFLEQYVSEPTWEQAIVDMFICNEEQSTRDLVVKDSLGGNDHNMIAFHIQFESELDHSHCRQLKKDNYNGMWVKLLSGL